MENIGILSGGCEQQHKKHSVFCREIVKQSKLNMILAIYIDINFWKLDITEFAGAVLTKNMWFGFYTRRHSVVSLHLIWIINHNNDNNLWFNGHIIYNEVVYLREFPDYICMSNCNDYSHTIGSISNTPISTPFFL